MGRSREKVPDGRDVLLPHSSDTVAAWYLAVGLISLVSALR